MAGKGVALATGKPQAFAVVPGPGLLNAGAALLTAYGMNAPVIGLILGAAIGIAVAYRQYAMHKVPETAPLDVSALTVAARNDLYGDAFNESILMRPGQWLTRLSVYFDNRGVDGLVNSLAALVGGTSGRWRKLQTGFVQIGRAHV